MNLHGHVILSSKGAARRCTNDTDPVFTYSEHRGNLPAVAELAEQLEALGEIESARGVLEEAKLRNPQAAESLNLLIEGLEGN